MAAPLIAGVVLVSRFILTKGLAKATKKFGKKVVDRTRKSDTFAKMIKNPPATTTEKVAKGVGIVGSAVGLSGVGAGFSTAISMQKFNKKQKEKKEAESKSPKDKKIKVELLEDKQTKSVKKFKNPRSPQNKKNKKLDTYTR